MADVFISYARGDRARVAPLVAAIEARGWSVWWDPEITAGQEFDDQIDAEIGAAKAVLVVWTPLSVASRWVRGEAREAAERGILVPVRFDQARLPMDVRAIHTTDLDGWDENPAGAQAQEFLRALAAMVTRAATAVQSAKDESASAAESASADSERLSVCVLPFVNMSGDPEQEYFSDGITEDIITDLSKVSSLRIISPNSAFLYKGKNMEIREVARELKVSHVLEGSVRKAGGRVRINVQLVAGACSCHVWAERYDRDASDIFALQDEISEAIVKALKLRLLPEEKKAIERHGTDSAEAHNLYLLARQTYITGQESDTRSAESIIRLSTRATELDPGYAQAWVLMAVGYEKLLTLRGGTCQEGIAAAERAMALDPGLAEPHAIKALILLAKGQADEAGAEVAIALDQDPESYEVNRSAGRLSYQLKRYGDAVGFYQKAVKLMDADLNSAMMLISCHTALGDAAEVHGAAKLAFERAEAALARDPNNSGVVACSVYALAALGEGERAKSRMSRALLIDPDNWNMRYNFACLLSAHLKDKEAALAMLDKVYETVSASFLPYAMADPDFEFLRDDPRYRAMVAAAEKRLGLAPAATEPVQAA